MGETNEKPMKWPSKVNRIGNLNAGDVNCLEWAVCVAKKKSKLKMSTIFRCGWMSNDGLRSNFHVLPIYYDKLWFVENYVPGVNDRGSIDTQPYDFQPTAKGLESAAKGFSNHFLVKMSEAYKLNSNNAQSVIEIVSPDKFKEIIDRFDGAELTQERVIKLLFGA